MDKETQKNTYRLLSQLDNPELENEAKMIMLNDPVEDLKLTLFDFFKKRLHKINEQESFKNKIREALEAKIDKDELSITQLMSLYRIVYSESTLATESLLSIFKPTKEGNVSPLLSQEKERNDEEQSIQNAFNNYSSEELQKIDKLMQLLNRLPLDKDK